MFEQLLSKIAKGLKRFKIDYMVIGDQAVIVHGQPRFTEDIDITLAIDSDRLPLLLKFIEKYDFKLLVNNPEEFVNKTKVLPVADSADFRIDFIFSSTEFEKEAVARAVYRKYGRTMIKIASPEDLIIHKIIAGRPKDVEDVKSVLIRKPDYDRKYVESWLRKFDKALDTSYLKSFKLVVRQIK